MEQRKLMFRVAGQHIAAQNSIEDIVNNTNGYLVAQFELDSLYENLMTAAVFTAQGKSYALVLDSESKVQVPREVLHGEHFNVGMIAGAGEGIITTDTVCIPLDESVRTRFTLNKSYIELYMQLKNEFYEFVNGANGILDEHIELSTQTEAGAHDLRVINGVFQYFNYVLSEWVDASTGAITNVIADNLTTKTPGKALDARQGYLLAEKLSEYMNKHKVTNGEFQYFFNGTMIPVAKKEDLDAVTEEFEKKLELVIYEEKTIAVGATARLCEIAPHGAHILIKTTNTIADGTVKRYSDYIYTGSTTGDIQIQFVGGIERAGLIATNIPATGFNLTNNMAVPIIVRVCNIPYFEKL